MDSLGRLLGSPLLPPLLLMLGPVALAFAHPTRTRPERLRLVALAFLAAACLALIALDLRPGVPIFAWEWHPSPQTQFQLLWLYVGWNWYLSLLVGLLGLVGILLSGSLAGRLGELSPARRYFHTRFLSLNLTTVAVVWLLINSANILATVFMWVALDAIAVVRQALTMKQHEVVQRDYSLVYHRSLGLGMMGSLVLLIGLFPSGVNGPGQMLVGAVLPLESVYALLIASVLRAGSFPFHVWLLPSGQLNLSVAERIFSHFLPSLSGLWLFGLSLDLAQRHPQVGERIVPLLVLAFGLAAFACLHGRNVSLRSTLVIVASVTLTALIGTLDRNPGVESLLLPVTGFALGGPLWIIASRMPAHAWGLAFRGLGLAALLGAPLTPGFPAMVDWMGARGASGSPLIQIVLWTGLPLFSAGVWNPIFSSQRNRRLTSRASWTMYAAAGGLSLPLLVIGLWPDLARIGADATSALNPAAESDAQGGGGLWLLTASVLAGIALGGLGLNYAIRRLRRRIRQLINLATFWCSLEWLSGYIHFGGSRLSLVWTSMLHTLEGAGFAGWILTSLILMWAILG